MTKEIDYIYRFMVNFRIQGLNVVRSYFWSFRYLIHYSRWWIIPGPEQTRNCCHLHTMGDDPATNVKLHTWTFIDYKASDTTDALCMLLDNLGLEYYIYGNEKRGWEIFLKDGKEVVSLSKLRKALNAKVQ